MTRVIHTPETLNVSLLFTFTGMTALDVSGDADNSECVDAAQTKNKSEEPIHLTNKQTNKQTTFINTESERVIYQKIFIYLKKQLNNK